MADEPKADSPTEGQVIFKTQDDFNKVIQERLDRQKSSLAKEFEQKYVGVDELKSELEKLREAERKRKEADMTEIQKIQLKYEEDQKNWHKEKSTLEQTVNDLKPHKERWESFIKDQEDKANTTMDKLIEEKKFKEEDKLVVLELPVLKRMDLIQRLAIQEDGGGKGGFAGQGGKLKDTLPKTWQEQDRAYEDFLKKNT